jgi:uncharacterized protein YndB with AHSA1/START domain
VTRETIDSGQRVDRDQTEHAISRVRKDSDAEINVEADNGGEILGKVQILAAPPTVFALLTVEQQMMRWLAWSVKADARQGGIFRLADLNGLWVEGAYLEVAPHQKVVLTWGGIEGLRSGQSTVEFNLHADGAGTVLRLRHFALPDATVRGHCLGWKKSGLPKLKAVAEGGEPRGTCLGDAADSRELSPHSAGVVW